MELSYLLTGIFLILLGFAIKHFKLYFLIAGYNTMGKAEKEKVNIEKVATLFRNVLGFIGLVMIVMGISNSYIQNPKIINIFFYVIIGGSVLFLLIKSNSKAYKNK